MTPERLLSDFSTSSPDGANADFMRLCLFDWIMCGQAGAGEPVSHLLRPQMAEAGEARLFGGGTASATQAALFNGATSHALDYDDTHFAHIGHTSVVVLSAVCAVAQAQGRTVDQLIEAAIVGSDAAVRIGEYFGRSHYQAGFHQTATSGAFGATLAVARLMELSPDQTIAAMGLCASQASGLKAQFGSMGKPINAGLAASAALQAASWALAGVTATPSGLRAFDDTHHGSGNEDAFHGLGDVWKFEGISHKFHACCHGLHAMLEALRQVDVPADEIERIVVETHPRWMTVCNIEQPTSGLQGKFSYKIAAAMSLAGLDTGDIKTFSDEIVKRSDIIALAQKVSVKERSDLKETEVRVTVTSPSAETVISHDIQTPMQVSELKQRLFDKAHVLVGAEAAERNWAAVHTQKAHQLTAVF